MALYQGRDVTVCFGGTLLEVVVRQDKVDEYVARLRELGIRHVEVTTARCALEHDDKLALIRRLRVSSPCSPRWAARATT